MPWKITHEVRGIRVGENIAYTTLDAEQSAKDMAREVIACDDERFNGSGTPLSSAIYITYFEEEA